MIDDEDWGGVVELTEESEVLESEVLESLEFEDDKIEDGVSKVDLMREV